MSCVNYCTLYNITLLVTTNIVIKQIVLLLVLALNCLNIFSCTEDGAITNTNTSLWKYIQQLKSHKNFLWFAAMNIVQVSTSTSAAINSVQVGTNGGLSSVVRASEFKSKDPGFDSLVGQDE